MSKKSAKTPLDAPRRLSVAWLPFAEGLAASLGVLEDDQSLVISVKRSNRYVQFAAQGAHGMRTETTCNSYLAKSERLDARQIAALAEAGWHAPTGKPGESTPENDPDGSPNFFRQFPVPVPLKSVADLAVSTLAEILRVPHPGFLEYEAFDADGQVILLPGLGLKRAVRSPQPEASLPELLRAALREVAGIPDLDFDEDGDIGIRYGSLIIFVRLMGDPPHVRLVSPLLADVDESQGLLARLNEINCRLGHMHLIAHNDAILAIADVPAAPFVSDHMAQALRDFCQLTDGMDDLLQGEFGGRLSFPEAMPSSLKH
ncbi:MAG: hypothetical protein A2286_03235 [Gammaproteobacteria bacterium RIFOXYA12_FULL_61_12]|nr:MAG: hypothetical protein A2514_06850 [Gammaproteobacteria bacterium RIFOXYD12_FULL_61_37]OGT93651.1 MAG: hypothetical protein A2286_03235 [Gammaproteobacteria bacterium RIFOXYA12_FULL_61_12]